MRLIVTKRGSYLLPVGVPMEWEDPHPGMRRPKWVEGGRFWRTPDGIVFARAIDDADE